MNEIESMLVEKLKSQFHGFEFKITEDKEKETMTIEAAKTKAIGFDVNISVSEKKARITFSSKIRKYMNFGMLVITVILTMIFGETILRAIGLIGHIGGNSFTLKLFYIIPILIFLAPLMIVGSLVLKKVNPPDNDLVNEVKACVTELGFSVED